MRYRNILAMEVASNMNGVATRTHQNMTLAVNKQYGSPHEYRINYQEVSRSDAIKFIQTAEAGLDVEAVYGTAHA